MPKRTLSDRLSLRRLLTLPHAALVLAVAVAMSALSWRAGRDTVDSLSGQLLVETVSRTVLQLERHAGGADVVLEAAFPTGLPVPEIQAQAQALLPLRERFWLATSVHRDPNNYVYYGDRRGHFIGLWRFSELQAELRLRTTGTGPRTLYRLSGINGELRSPVTEDKVFDPRERPWYHAALAQPAALGWTPVYVDFKTQDLIITRTKRITNDVGEPEGVAATDLPLKQVNALLGRLKLGENAVAMVAEADGRLIGVSRGTHMKTPAAAEHERLNALESPDALVAASFAAVRERVAGGAGSEPGTFSFDDVDGRGVQVGHARLDPALGLDWLIVVAVPRDHFLAGVQHSTVQSAVLAGVATLIALALGWATLGIVTRELRRLSEAARRVGDGALDAPPEVNRDDELGELARSLADMQQRLLTDPLTGLSNRSAMLRRIEDRILQQRRRGDRWPFAIMRVDFDRFADLNARFGHAVGDTVLKEIGQRLRAGVRIGDIVARYGGDEFLLLLESVDNRADAEAAGAHLAATLRAPLQSLGDTSVEASFGIAFYPDDGQDTEALLKHAGADRLARQTRQDARAT